jgi:hypothetical protein
VISFGFSFVMNKVWVTEPNGYLEPKIGASGMASMPAQTIIEIFQETVRKYPNHNAVGLKRPVNGTIPAEWKFWTWQEYYNDSERFARAISAMGVPVRSNIFHSCST